MRRILVLGVLAVFAAYPALAQHTTGEGNAIDNSNPAVPGHNGQETTTNDTSGAQKPMVAASPQTVSGSHMDVKTPGDTCKADSDCETGSCKTAGEGRICVPKQN